MNELVPLLSRCCGVVSSEVFKILGLYLLEMAVNLPGETLIIGEVYRRSERAAVRNSPSDK